MSVSLRWIAGRGLFCCGRAFYLVKKSKKSINFGLVGYLEVVSLELFRILRRVPAYRGVQFSGR
jgi:hypothetical protein